MRVWRDAGLADRLPLYSADTALGWRKVRSIRRDVGRRGCERRTMRAVVDHIAGTVIGYQLIGAAEARGDRDLPTLRSSAAISVREMQAAAGVLGASCTAGRREEDRTRRHPRTGTLLPMEDFVERTQAKVRVYPRVGAAQGDILRAWPR